MGLVPARRDSTHPTSDAHRSNADRSKALQLSQSSQQAPPVESAQPTMSARHVPEIVPIAAFTVLSFPIASSPNSLYNRSNS